MKWPSSHVLEYARDVGPLYGVEHFAMFLYSLIRMQRPHVMLELGSGSGACALMAATAFKENGYGSVLSVDDESQWEKLSEQPPIQRYLTARASGHLDFLRDMACRFSLTDHVTFEYRQLPDFPDAGRPIDILFADYESQPSAITKILRFYLPKMNQSCSLFIDGASTYLPSFLHLERIVQQLNSGKVPQSLVGDGGDESRRWWVEFAATHTFNLVHLTEAIDRKQNSTAWLLIAPVDHRPHPVAKMT